MSTSEENEHFSDGITEEIINALAKNEALKVTSRTSAFFFKGKNIPMQEIGKQLGVSTLLEGSVRLAGDTIRITAQLIDASEDYHFWSETWDRKLDNIFEVQDEISLLIAEKLREQVGHFEIEEHLVPVRHTEIGAYEWYLKSKVSFAKFQKADLLQAVDEIENAISIDPECPFYHASKAIYYSYMGLINVLPASQAFSISKTAAIRALQLDPTDPEANYSMGIGYYFFEKDLETAEKYLNQALKYRPNYVMALLGGSVMDVIAGYEERAISRVKKAIELDPLTHSHIYYHASALQRLGRYEEALTEVNKLLKVIPHHTNSYCLKGTILTRLKQFDEAIELYKTVPVSPEKTVEYYAGTGITYAYAGNLEKAEEYLAKYEAEDQNLHLASEENPSVIINIYLGNIALAFKELEKDIAAGKYYLHFWKEVPAFKLLDDDPRYRLFDSVFKSEGITQVEAPTETSRNPKKELLDEQQITSHSTKLLEYMSTQKPFLDAGLSLRSLADQVGLSPNQLSLVINEGLGQNFNNFVNHYRVEEFKTLAKDPAHSNMTIVGLAFECGFNSKTVFNTYFKEKTGLNPSEFLKS